jgi:hypothetical protein
MRSRGPERSSPGCCTNADHLGGRRDVGRRLTSISASVQESDAHHLLVTSAERFRFRVYILQRGFKVIAALVFRSTRRTEMLASWPPRASRRSEPCSSH